MSTSRPKYRNRDTERFAEGIYVKRLASVPDLYGRVQLDAIEQAEVLEDLRNPPGNHLEKLRGDRSGQYSIRINLKWRICFEWDDDRQEAFNLEIVDYHD
jgi:proteic killer suppression protein